VAPLASEAPEFIVAIVFALHDKGSDAIGTLISSKVSQWTMLVGSLPVAYLAGGGGTALPLDGRQVEEFLLTATQALLGVAVLLTLRFPRWLALTLLGLFAAQYAVPGQAGRYLLCAIYGGIAAAALVRNRRYVLPALAAPFRGLPGPAVPSEPGPGSGPRLSPGHGEERGDPLPYPGRPGGAGTAVLEAPARTRVAGRGTARSGLRTERIETYPGRDQLLKPDLAVARALRTTARRSAGLSRAGQGAKARQRQSGWAVKPGGGGVHGDRDNAVALPPHAHLLWPHGTAGVPVLAGCGESARAGPAEVSTHCVTRTRRARGSARPG
jgi:hypothetical protein